MRRLVFSTIAALGLVMVGPSTAFADPASTASATATPGKKICKVTDPKLDELSGIVATKTGFIVIDDGSDDPTHQQVFFLNDKCAIVNEVEYSGAGPRDTEDMILSPDGRTLWIADTGDDGVRNPTPTHRPSVALWTMPADGSAKPKLHRLSYPEGDYHDAEALLLNGDGTPLIVTKELGKAAAIYEPASALKTDNVTGVPLKKVGELTVTATDTPSNTLAHIGNKSIDGGAIGPKGTKVVLRTYTDALEWDVTGGDVLAALKTKPRTTGLPNEPFGEAITYSADGKTFYTVSDMNGNTADAADYILQYTPSTTTAVLKKASSNSSSGGSGKAWYADLTIDQITYMVAGIGVLGLILVGVGVLGIMRFRKRPPPETAAGVGGFQGAGADSGDPETELIVVGGAPQRAGVYGGAAAEAGAYGRPTGPGAGRPGNGGFGGAPGGAPRYARSAQGATPQGAQPPNAQPQNAQPQNAQPQGGPAQRLQGGQPQRGGQQPPRGPQGPQQPPPGRDGVYGAPSAPPPARDPQPANGGQQPPRTPGGGPRPPESGQRPQGPGQRAQESGQRPQGPGQRAQESGQRPQGGGQRPQESGQRPQGGGQRPQGGGPRPPESGQRPQGGGPRPPESGQRPQGSGPRPPESGQRPQGPGQRPQGPGPTGGQGGPGPAQRPPQGPAQRPQQDSAQRPQPGAAQRPQQDSAQRPQPGAAQRPQQRPPGAGQRSQGATYGSQGAQGGRQQRGDG